MEIKRVTINNWKCFDRKTFKFNKGRNILNMPNGTGKSSMIEAISFCLFDKRPNNLTINDLKKDNLSPTKIEIETFDGTTITRNSEGKNLYQIKDSNGNNIATTGKEFKEYVENNSNTYKFWSKGSLSESEILSPSFIKTFLDEIFKETKEIRNNKISEKSYILKEIKSLESSLNTAEVGEDIEKIKEELQAVKSKIKNRINISDESIKKALSLKELEKENTQLIAEFNSLDKNYYDDEKLAKIDRLFNGKDIKEEQERIKDFSDVLDHRASFEGINEIINISNKNSCCLVCERSIDKKIRRIDDKYDKYKNVKMSVDYNVYANSKRRIELKRTIESNQRKLKSMNYEEIISNYNKRSNELLNEEKRLESLLKKKEEEISINNKINKLKFEYNELLQDIRIIDQYNNETMDKVIYNICSIASNTLQKINNRYVSIISNNGNFNVVYFDSNMESTNINPVYSMSSGERTIIALALMKAFIESFNIQGTLVFDESFSNLDSENLKMVIEEINSIKNQIILVSHHQIWKEKALA